MPSKKSRQYVAIINHLNIDQSLSGSCIATRYISHQKVFKSLPRLPPWWEWHKKSLKVCKQCPNQLVHSLNRLSGYIFREKKSCWMVAFLPRYHHKISQLTLPETNSSPLKIGLPNRKGSYSNHPFSGANLLLVSGSRVTSKVWWL